MEVFNLTLTQMLVMFLLMLTGYILKKGKFIPNNSSAVISKFLAFVLAPALTLNNQIANCTPQTFAENSQLILYGLGSVLIAIGISYPLSALFIKNKDNLPELTYQRQIYKYGLTFGNFGYMGSYIVLGIWGDVMLFKYNMFTFIMNIVVYVWGIYILVPKSENSRGVLANLKAGLLTPAFISLVLGMVIGITGLSKYVPTFITSSLGNAGNCMGPMAMLLAGVVIGEYNFSELLKNKKIYIVTLLRLIIIPAVFVSVLKLFNVSHEIIVIMLIAYATPMGLNTVVFPAAYGGDTKTGAAMTMISSILSIATIPLMYYIFAVLL